MDSPEAGTYAIRTVTVMESTSWHVRGVGGGTA
jgi:hypothetical protein